MKSRISIDFDENNAPCIKIDYYPSDDVRDKMVRRFLSSCANSTSGLIKISEVALSEQGSFHQLTPIPFDKMEDECKANIAWVNEVKSKQFNPDTV